MAPDPTLRKATSLAVGDTGKFEFKAREYVQLTNNNQTAEWTGDVMAAWIPIETTSTFHSGKFTFDFDIANIGSGQIGVGFLLDWEKLGPDWGFFGYLGASGTAWSYDPTTGDIVTSTNSIHGGLPKLNSGGGVISLELDLPREAEGKATFIVNGVRTPTIDLPEGAVVVPAACFLKKGQKVTITNLK